MRTAENKASAPPFHVLIAAAGTGDRFGGEIPKQYALLNGIPVLRHSLDIFLNHPKLASIHIIINPDHTTLYTKAVHDLNLPPPIYGSDNRNSSIYNGLKELSKLKNEDIILIHDAVRPLLKKEDLELLLKDVLSSGAASLANQVTDTLRKSTGEIVSRENLWSLQTPQAFHYGILRRAHENGHNLNSITDDTSLVSAMGFPVKLVEGSRHNIKITLPEDMQLAEKLLQLQYDVHTGMGFDVHAFDKQDLKRPLILCGIKIDHEYGLAGHSDADVAMHAITDALLGAIAEGDIGHHFPPSNPAYKNMNSDVFLKQAKKIADSKNAVIQNIDLTIICESPKIGPYRERMQTRISEILNLPTRKIGIKATTTEQLGFTGRGEGIAAQAVVTIKIPGENQ